ncbi:MAG: hypothetical protein DRJ40_05765 [Thermoprotei archaeon]|nr:MAG: hypothetical protein DRJ40_05765 [Thermoprotei archaeon]
MKLITKLIRLILILLTIASAIIGIVVKAPLPLATILLWLFLGRYLIDDRALRKLLGALVIGLAISTTYLALKYPGYNQQPATKY